jgi:hypothetical protein
VGAIVLVFVTLSTRDMVAQQALGQIAYTLGTLDYSEVHLRGADGTDQVLSPQIQVHVPPSFGVPGNTATASVASLGHPVWSKDRGKIVANALLAPTSSDQLNNLLFNGFSTPSKILVTFDPTTGQGDAVFDMNTPTPMSPYVIDAAFAPDGNRLVYAYLQTNFIVYGIINRDGTGNVPLLGADLTEQALGMGIDWSPRTDQLGNYGNLLLVSYPLPDWSCGTPRTAAGLVLAKLGSTVTYQVLTHPQYCDWGFNSMHDRSPAFSPNGTQVAFVRAIQDSNGIVVGSAVMVINGSGAFGSERLLTYVPGEMIQHLSWSQDGSRVMFDRTQVGFGGLTSSYGVWTLTAPASGTGVLSQVSALGLQADFPAWGPAK